MSWLEDPEVVLLHVLQLPVAAHGLARLVDRGLHVTRGDRLHVRHHEVEAAVLLLDRVHRHEDHVVHAPEEELALPLQDPDHPEGPAVERDLLVHGLDEGEEGVGDVHPDHHHVRGAVDVGRGEEAPLLDVAVVDLFVGGGGAEDLRLAGPLRPVLHVLDGNELEGSDRLDRRLRGDHLDLVHRQPLATAPLVVVQVLPRGLGSDEDRGGPEGRDLLRHRGVEAGHDRAHAGDGHDAHHHPEDGEEGAHLVRADALEADPDGLVHRHQDGVAFDEAGQEAQHHSFLRASTGSRAAARFAG